MKLIVGLGNIGTKYSITKHNIGFMIIDSYAKTQGLEINKSGFDATYAKFKYLNEDIILFKPSTYMNNSGTAIKQVRDYYKINNNDILIIYDDLMLPLGKVRLRMGGSSGGHNGIQNCIDNLGDGFRRLRIGIRDESENIRILEYVLSEFKKDELEVISQQQVIYNSIIEDFLKLPFDALMSKYNKKC